MHCRLCSQKSVYKELCKEHFVAYVEKKVEKTIKKFGLFDKKDKIVVAASGGKDSLSLLFILSRLGYSIHALAVDEGIPKYRDDSLSTLKRFCKKNNVDLKVVSFKENIGKPLVEIVKMGERPCTVCGVFRRYLLNMHSKGYDVLATGHNMDDEAQAVIMNLLKNNLSQFTRQGPCSGSRKMKNFTPRVKPLYFCLEKEMMVYSFLNGLTDEFNECPFVSGSFRLKVRDYLNELEDRYPGTKESIVNWYLKQKKINVDAADSRICRVCGENSAKDMCNACVYMRKICS
ncbi:MAG: TIGR00269 family protein [Candidatus Woesearchaeota archaeon]|nr:TIGR00269 family protein [Candidatus Woesearchaeota archaeon]